MSTNTSFNVEDAEAFLFELQQLQEIIQHDWTGVLNQWENLKVVWRDENFYIFEETFSDLAASYQMTEAECAHRIAFLNQQILIVNKLQSALSNLSSDVLQAAIASSALSSSSSASKALNLEHNFPTTIDQAFLDKISPIIDQAKTKLQEILKEAEIKKNSRMALSKLLLLPCILSFAIAKPTTDIILPLIDLNNRILAIQGMPTANNSIVKLFNEFAEQSDKYLGEYGELVDHEAERKEKEREERERQSENTPSSITTVVD